MANQPWQEEFDKKWEYAKASGGFRIHGHIVQTLIKDYISELLQEEREKTIKWSPVRILDFARKQGFTAGYKAGREEILKWAEGKKKIHREFECNGANKGRGCYEDWCNMESCISADAMDCKGFNKALEELQTKLTNEK